MRSRVVSTVGMTIQKATTVGMGYKQDGAVSKQQEETATAIGTIAQTKRPPSLDASSLVIGLRAQNAILLLRR